MISDVYNWLTVAGVSQEGTPEQFQLFVDLVQEELNECIDAQNKEELIDGFVDLLWMVLNGSYMMGVSLEELQLKINRVSWSNWTKFCTTEQEAIDTVQAYKTGKHPSKPNQVIECYYEKVGDFYVIKRMDNKILKALSFQEP